MDVGFETIGNATVIGYDRGPVIATDPWITGGAYFGSWALSHRVPEEQQRAIRGCKFLWISHGHPDHLSGESLEQLRDRKILVPDHRGGRIRRDLESQGFDVHVIPDRVWTPLSARIRVMSIPDYNQDAVLLLDINGRLVVNLNDAGPRGWGRLVRQIVASYKVAYLLALSGYGDADMINFFTETGERIPPPAAARVPPGQTIARMTEFWGARYFIPSSSMHQYQRADSAWANAYTTKLDDYARGFESTRSEILPAFLRVDCAGDRVEPIRPPALNAALVDPKTLGDDWSEPLERQDAVKLTAYFEAIETLRGRVDWIEFKVGGKRHRVELPPTGLKRGITFEAPRGSLIKAIEWEIFDDLLIGNFMKTTLHGAWGELKLYPDFTPYVAKYADNGRAKTPEELKRYFDEYRERDRMGFLFHQAERVLTPIHARSANVLRAALKPDSGAYKLAKNAYWRVRELM